MAKKKFSQAPYNRQHLRHIVAQGLRVRELFDKAANTAGIVGESITPADTDADFYLKDYPIADARIDWAISQLHDELVSVIQSGNATEWALSNAKNDELVNSILQGADAARVAKNSLFSRNLDALEAFNNRKVEGMSLSDRVWSFMGKTKQEFELALGLGVGTGRSADQLSRDIRNALNDPDRLFRRVRDKYGELRLSKAAQAYHPGRGVYRSSYKNALRLTATENNMAYRSSDHERWMQNPFVIGIEIKPSINNHPVKDICDDLAGRYPKEFEWTGWHPFCRCFATAIIADEKQRDAYYEANAAGEDVEGWEFEGTIKDMPKGWNNWVADNEERIARAKSMPYFIRDNFKDGDVAKGVRWIENGAQNSIPTLEELTEKFNKTVFLEQQEADDILRPVAGKAWLNTSEGQHDAISAYTGSHYLEMNAILRGEIAHPSEYMKTLINDATEYISKNELPCDMLLSRRTTKDTLLNFGLSPEEIAGIDNSNVKKLIGKRGIEKGFTSCHSTKNRANTRVKVEIYAPAGTKAAYVEPFSELGYGVGEDYEKWDGKQKQGKLSYEQETTLQRSTEFMILDAFLTKEGHLRLKMAVVRQLI